MRTYRLDDGRALRSACCQTSFTCPDLPLPCVRLKRGYGVSVCPVCLHVVTVATPRLIYCLPCVPWLPAPYVGIVDRRFRSSKNGVRTKHAHAQPATTSVLIAEVQRSVEHLLKLAL